jgi:hypothetical protein
MRSSPKEEVGMGTVGSTDKKIGSPRPSDREREVQFRSAANKAGVKISVPDPGPHFDFEAYSLSEEKRPEEQIKTPLLVASSPPRLKPDRNVKLDEQSSEDLPPEKEEDCVTQPEIKTSEYNSFEYLSRVPSDKRQEYELWLRSELTKRCLDGYHDLRFKTVDGNVRVHFSRRFTGGAVALNTTHLEEAIRRAEQMVMLLPIAETDCLDPHDRIIVKRSTDAGKQYIELINVPRKSPLANVLRRIVLHFVSRMFDGKCESFRLTRKGLHAFRVAASGKKRPEFSKIDLKDYEDAILKVTMVNLDRLKAKGYDIHRLDEQTIGRLRRAVQNDLAKDPRIVFESVPSVRVVDLDD